MRIAQISDVHFTRVDFNPLRLRLKRLAGTFNWLLFRKEESDHAPLARLPDLFRLLEVDLVLVGGDLSSTSLHSEFKTAKRYFDLIEQPKIFIPGNHDQYTPSAYRQKRFYTSFKNSRPAIEHRAEFFTLKEHGVEAHKIAPGWWCVALDNAPSTKITSSNGVFSPIVERNLEEVLSLLPKEDSILLLNHFPFFQNSEPKHRLIHGERLRALIERDPRIRFYLHGHTHRHTIADLRPSGLPIILDSGCPIQKSHATWNLLELQNNTAHVHAYHWDGLDWTPFAKHAFNMDL